MSRPSASGQISKMIIGPGSAGSLGDFLNPESTKEDWLHGGKKTKQVKQRRDSLCGTGIGPGGLGTCTTPGQRVQSKGKGKGLARGKGQGPIGVPFGQSLW